MRFILAVILFYGTFSFAQSGKVFNRSNGLPSNVIYQVIQDENKYIWSVTDQGVARYFGEDFEAYFQVDGLTAIENFEVVPIDHKLYFLGENGKISVFENDEFDELDLSFNAFVSEVLVKEDGTIIASSFGDGIKMMKDEKITSLLTSEDVIDPYVSFIWQWGDTLLAISKTGLYEYRNKEFYPLKLFDPPVHFSRAVLLDEKVLFSVKNKLMVINRKSEINEISNSNWLTKKVINKIQLVDDRLFCSTYQGAYEISIEDDSLHLIKAFNKDLEVTSIMKDHESNYWCSTLGDGLLKFSNLDYELLNNKDTYGILVKDNTIYTGMGSTEYLIYENGTINYGKLQPKNSFVNQKIRDLKFLNGALWFEVDGGIARVEKGQTYYYRTGVGEIVEYMGKPVIGNKTGCYILDSWKQFDELHPNVKPRKLMYDLVKPIIS